jgi:glycosyltransferase involved in cell wall biosynthesis
LLHSSAGAYGADRQLLLVAEGVRAAGLQPLAVLPGRGTLAGALEAHGVEVTVRELAVLRRGLASPRGLAALARAASADARALAGLARERRAALVHSNTSVVLGGAAASALARVPHVWHVREIYTRFGAAWPPYRRLLLSAAALPCVSRATAAQFGHGSRARARVRVLPDGLAVTRSPATRAGARAALGLEPDVPVIAVLGRISDWKGQDVLVRALAQPPLAEVGAVGLLAGEPWPGAERRLTRVVELARELDVHRRLRLLGFREDVETVYGAADLIVVPSTAPDPLPGAAIEAAAAGCAVIASAHGGLPEILDDGRTGRLVTPGDAGALARAARELIDDPSGRAALGAAAAAEVRARFAPEHLLEGIASLYAELLAGR